MNKGRPKIKYAQNEFINGVKFLKEIPIIKGNRKGEFKCKCGNNFITNIAHVKTGHTKTCGCMVKIHGDTTNGKIHYLYTLWRHIKSRCYDVNYHAYKWYGARNITMRKNWIKNYAAFKYDILSTLGERPKGQSLDRINNDGNYVLSNLRWATPSQQIKNRRPKELIFM